MPGRLPWLKFYGRDFSADMEEHSLEIAGAWILILCKLMDSKERGVLSRTLPQWSRILKVTEEKARGIIVYLKDEKICDFEGDIDHPGAKLTIISRRMVYDEKQRSGGRTRQQRFREKQREEAETAPKVASNNDTDNGKGDVTDNDSRDVLFTQESLESESELESEKRVKKRLPIDQLRKAWFAKLQSAYPERCRHLQPGKFNKFHEQIKSAGRTRRDQARMFLRFWRALKWAKRDPDWFKDNGRYIHGFGNWVNEVWKRYDRQDCPENEDRFHGKD